MAKKKFNFARSVVVVQSGKYQSCRQKVQGYFKIYFRKNILSRKRRLLSRLEFEAKPVADEKLMTNATVDMTGRLNLAIL